MPDVKSTGVDTKAAGKVARAVLVATLVAASLGALAGCGQRGPLYYPDQNNPDRRR